MHEVQFDEEPELTRAVPAAGEKKRAESGAANWLVSHGFARDAAGANALLIFLALLLFAAAIAGFFFLQPQPKAPTDAQLRTLEIMKARSGIR
ncbi:MAG: hypothetical protein ABA06_00100 [Parcubacteria bacterium C7867-001]|nr:MAG: hypothetical protein ABA06_00100 [Parcubacteria bacterium C7867-001]